MSELDREARRRDRRCSFCGKGQDKVKKLVAGPGVYICDKCIHLCVEVLEQDAGQGSKPHVGSGPSPRRNWWRSLLR